MALNAMRYDLASRIVERLGPESGGITAAMTTGHETWISEEQNQVMRDSGLYHIISISGMHLALVGGGAFFLLAWGLAAIEPLARRMNVRKLAAAEPERRRRVARRAPRREQRKMRRRNA